MSSNDDAELEQLGESSWTGLNRPDKDVSPEDRNKDLLGIVGRETVSKYVDLAKNKNPKDKIQWGEFATGSELKYPVMEVTLKNEAGEVRKSMVPILSVNERPSLVTPDGKTYSILEKPYEIINWSGDEGKGSRLYDLPDNEVRYLAVSKSDPPGNKVKENTLFNGETLVLRLIDLGDYAHIWERGQYKIIEKCGDLMSETLQAGLLPGQYQSKEE